MSSDPLARPDLETGAPNDTEYDAVHAAVTATERGRWFLTEYATRNRRADTDLLIAALARVETAIRGDAQPSSASRRDLTEIAATIERVRAAIASDKAPASEVGAAPEPVQDPALDRRERTVDTTLGDALNAAAREISDAGPNKAAAGEHPPGATQLLRELAGRVDKLIKVSRADPVAHRPGQYRRSVRPGAWRHQPGGAQRRAQARAGVAGEITLVAFYK